VTTYGCRSGALAYEHAEPEVKRQLIQAAFDKLWVVDAEIAGADLKPGYVTLLDDELVTELERAGQNQGTETPSEAADGFNTGTTYFREAGSFSLTEADLELTGIPVAEEDLWAASGATTRTAALGSKGPHSSVWGPRFER
jgi:hypothetical protein